jgi:ribA/ribD-fused uncharacterized protein
MIIEEFKGEYRFLSNFWRAEIRPYWWPDTLPAFPGNEWLFQAWKVNPDDTFVWLPEVEWIRTAPTPGEAKRRGRITAAFRPDWEDLKIDVMRYCVQLKFRNHADLRTKLLATGDAELIEGNWWNDTYWGVCDGVGENHLGKLLMEEREVLR